MKILSCYIVGFGKFVDKKFQFDSDLTVIKEDNGFGKTTLAAFIRCMLFGLDGGRTRSVETNDRARYEPWRGSVFGGALTFSYQGKRYTIERSFGKTPAYDKVRLYDENNMQSFDFGDNVERLGEVLFGIDAESYQKSTYVPQGDVRLDGLPDDIKSRLLALLSTGGTGESAQSALDKLEEADRELRAKRKPKMGKLDAIDERLYQIAEKKATCDEAAVQAEKLRGELSVVDRDMKDYQSRLTALDTDVENAVRQSEMKWKRERFEQLQGDMSKWQEDLAQAEEFFNGNDPETVNTDGIKEHVQEYYSLQEELRGTEKALLSLEDEHKEYASLKGKEEAYEKQLSDCQEEAKRAQKASHRRRGKKIIPPKNKYIPWIIAAGFVLAIAGAILADIIAYVGFPMLGVGVVAMIVCFILIVPRHEKLPKEEVAAQAEGYRDRIDQAQADLDGVRAELSRYAEFEGKYSKLAAERESAKSRMDALEKGIVAFLQNFRYEEIYDYRTATAQLEEKVAAYVRLKKDFANAKGTWTELDKEKVQSSAQTTMNADVESLKQKKVEISYELRNLSNRYGHGVAQLSALENSADKTALLEEEKTLLAEKERLEAKHRAILLAKSYLLHAKENMSSRYLQPVTEKTTAYLDVLGGAGEIGLSFQADGTPVRQDGGQLRDLGYYSEGYKELIGLSIRIALADTLYQKELPPLILDDPFVNLDDEKTVRAKKLVKDLSKRYQIIYMTCTKERML